MKQLRTTAIVVMALALATAGLASQQRGGAKDGTGPLFDTSHLLVFQGTVVQLVAGLGQGMPELELAATGGQTLSFALGPYWFLQASGFVAEAGDAAEVSAYACTTCESGCAVVKVVNQTRALTLVLRADDGTPLWGAGGGKSARRQLGRAGNGGPAQGSGKGGDCDVCEPPDLGEITTFTGTVAAFSATAGAGTPTLTLATSAGDVSLLISPYSILQRAGFTLAVGETLEVTAAPVTHDGIETWLTLVIKDTATGLTVVLRDPSTGLPPVGRGRR